MDASSTSSSSSSSSQQSPTQMIRVPVPAPVQIKSSSTDAFLKDFTLVAEAAKRAQVAVMVSMQSERLSTHDDAADDEHATPWPVLQHIMQLPATPHDNGFFTGLRWKWFDWASLPSAALHASGGITRWFMVGGVGPGQLPAALFLAMRNQWMDGDDFWWSFDWARFPRRGIPRLGRYTSGVMRGVLSP